MSIINCCVCLENDVLNFSSKDTSNCSHPICKDCFRKIVKITCEKKLQKPLCPLCRMEITSISKKYNKKLDQLYSNNISEELTIQRVLDRAQTLLDLNSRIGKCEKFRNTKEIEIFAVFEMECGITVKFEFLSTFVSPEKYKYLNPNNSRKQPRNTWNIYILNRKQK